MGFFSNMFNPGKKYLRAASRYLERAEFKGGNIGTAGGIRGGFTFDDEGNLIQGPTSLGQFQGAFQQLLGAGQGFLDASTMAPEDLLAEFGLGGNTDELRRIFQQNAALAGQDPLQRGEQITDLLRSRRERGAQNLVNSTFDRLFASGGLSNQTTREQVTGDMRRQLADEDMGFQLAGIEYGENSVQNAFARMMGAQQSMSSNAALGAGLREQLFNQGMASIGGAQQLDMAPLAMMNMVAALQGQRSNTLINQATGMTGVGQARQSDFLNFSNWFADFTESMSRAYANVAG